MHPKSLLLAVLLSAVLLACESGKNDSGDVSPTTDTTIGELKGDSTTYKPSDEDRFEFIKDSLRLVAEQIKKEHPDPLELVRSEIHFDADFNPTLVAQVKNNRKTGVISFEIIINPNKPNEDKCEIITKKIKASVPPNKTITIKSRIIEQIRGESCLKIEFARVTLGDYVLSNGIIKHPPNIFIEDNSDKQ